MWELLGGKKRQCPPPSKLGFVELVIFTGFFLGLMGFIIIIIIIIPHIWDNIFGTFSERRRCTDHPGAHEKWWLEDKPFLLGPGNFSVAKR